jgi:hypothetical protein
MVPDLPYTELQDVLLELVHMKHLDEYSLRVIAQIAHSTLKNLSQPDKRQEAIKRSLLILRGSLKPYLPDSDFQRIYDILGKWYRDFQTGPRFMDENPADNPIFLPGGDTVPGAFIHQWAIQHNFSKEFSDELQEQVSLEMNTALSEEEVNLYLLDAAARVRHQGTVYVGTKEAVEVVRRLFRKHGVMYDMYPVFGGFMIWIPRGGRKAARALLAKSGIRSFVDDVREEM